MDVIPTPGLRSARRAVLAVTALGLVLTATVIWFTSAARTQVVESRLEQQGAELVHAVRSTMRQGLERSNALAGLIESSARVTEDEFERFAMRIGPADSVVVVGHFAAGAMADRADFFYRRMTGLEQQLDAAIPDLLDVGEQRIIGPLSAASPTMILVASPVFGPGEAETMGVAYAVVDIAAVVTRPQLDGLEVAARPERPFEPSTPGLGQWRSTDVVGDGTWAFAVDDPSATQEVWVPAVVTGLVGLLATAMVAGATYVQISRRETERAFEALRQTAADKDRFMASVSHELRTPLTSVLGLANVLSEAWREMDASEVQAFLVDIENESEELSDLVEDLLTIGRDESGVLTYAITEIDLDAEIRRVTRRLTCRDEVELRIEPGMGTAMGDPLRFRQIVRNLLVNACRHADSIVEITCARRAGFAAVTVSNDGEDIPAAHVDRLFQPYQAGLRAGQPGSIGLGLYVSRRLARGMGGELTHAPSGDMVVFELSLPAGEHSSSESADAAPYEVTRNAGQAS